MPPQAPTSPAERRKGANATPVLKRTKTRQKGKKSTFVKKGRQTKRDTMRKWGVPEYVHSWNLRYQNPIEKGILWYFFSLFVRNRDVKEYGTCISCGRTITVETSQAGHYAPAGSCGPELLFDEKNVNAECPHCNAWDDMHLVGYGRGLDTRYGSGTSDNLQTRRESYLRGAPAKQWKKEAFEKRIAYYKERI